MSVSKEKLDYVCVINHEKEIGNMTCEHLTPGWTSTNGPVIYCRINGSKCPYVPYRTFHQCANFNPIMR